MGHLWGQHIILDSFLWKYFRFCDWNEQKNIDKLVRSVGRRRGCYINHCEDIEFLGINVCFLLLLHHKRREMRAKVAVVTMTGTPILLTRQNWQNHMPNKTTVREFFFQNGQYNLFKVRRCLRHNLCSHPYGSKSFVRSTRSAVWNF
jgi:hypothetical protein